MLDRERFMKPLGGRNMFKYHGDITLSGYRLYLNSTFITMEHKLYKCALLETGNPDDQVLGAVVSPDEDLNNAQLEHFERLLTNADHVIGTVMGGEEKHALTTVFVNMEQHEEEEEEEEENGSSSGIAFISSLYSRLRLTSSTSSSVVLPDRAWVHVTGGDYSAVRPLMELIVSLHRMGVWNEEEKEELLRRIAAGEVTHLPASAFARIAIHYGFCLKDESAVRRFISEVQLLLRHLNYLSVFVEINGVLSEVCCGAILEFQRQQNILGEYVETLQETGRLCKDTYNCLRDTLKQVLANLKTLGYQLSFNPLHPANAEKMKDFVDKVQKNLKIGVYIRGSLCSVTRAAIHRHVYECEVGALCSPYCRGSRLQSSCSSYQIL